MRPPKPGGNKLKFYEPEEEVRENCQGLNCAYVKYAGAIWTPMVFTQFLLEIIASQVRNIGFIQVET